GDQTTDKEQGNKYKLIYSITTPQKMLRFSHAFPHSANTTVHLFPLYPSKLSARSDLRHAYIIKRTTAKECAAKSGGSVVEHHPSYWEQPFNQPYFDNTTKRDTTTTVGQTAFLPCRVRNLGDRAVSFASFQLIGLPVD
ncbi:unnamed protein product, partial [Heterotrigona itama]